MSTSPVEPPAAVECAHCTVPTGRPGGVCQFCVNYRPPTVLDDASPGYGCSMGVPTTLLDGAANHATMAAEDIDDQIAALPANASMWLTVDLVRAQRHLRAAVRLIEQAGTQLDTQVVAL